MRACSALARRLGNSEMSAPEMKASGVAPRMIMTRTSGSASSSATPLTMSCQVRRLSALRTCGRLRMSHPRRASWRTSSGSSSSALVFTCSLIIFQPFFVRDLLELRQYLVGDLVQAAREAVDVKGRRCDHDARNPDVLQRLDRFDARARRAGEFDRTRVTPCAVRRLAHDRKQLLEFVCFAERRKEPVAHP